MSEVTLIITAGGSGVRFGGHVNKQFVEINNKPILSWTLERFVNLKFIDEIIITLPSSSEYSEKFKGYVKFNYPSGKIKFVEGGITRQLSVFNALKSITNIPKYVFIHDGVRPFITYRETMEIYETVKKHKAVIPVSPVRNTIKRILNNVVVETLVRKDVYEVHTPQAFDYKLIMDCYIKAEKDKVQVTDDASLIEAYGHRVYTVTQDTLNLKITQKEDLKIAQRIISEFTREDDADRFWL